MKKLLSILTSVTIVASVPSFTISCSSKKTKDDNSGGIPEQVSPTLTSASYSNKVLTIQGTYLTSLFDVEPLITNNDISKTPKNLEAKLDQNSSDDGTLVYKLNQSLDKGTYNVLFIYKSGNLTTTFTI